jgi:hypothetical protein
MNHHHPRNPCWIERLRSWVSWSLLIAVFTSINVLAGSPPVSKSPDIALIKIYQVEGNARITIATNNLLLAAKINLREQTVFVQEVKLTSLAGASVNLYVQDAFVTNQWIGKPAKNGEPGNICRFDLVVKLMRAVDSINSSLAQAETKYFNDLAKGLELTIPTQSNPAEKQSRLSKDR